MENTEIAEKLAKHEAHSNERFAQILKSIDAIASHHIDAQLTQPQKGKIMEHGHGVEDKIEIHNNVEDRQGGGGLGSLAALAALGRDHHGFGGIAGGGLAGLAAGFFGGLVGDTFLRGRGGFGEGGRREASEIERFIELQTLGNIQKDIATSANETQAVVNQNGSNQVQTTLQQTIALQQALNALAQSTQSNFCQTNTLVQAGTNEVVSNVLQNRFATAEGLCSVKTAIENDGDKTRAIIIRQYEDTLNRQLASRENEVFELRNEARRAADKNELKIENINTNTQMQLQAQAQQQQQQQFSEFLRTFGGALVELRQIATATNSNIIAGNTGAVTTGLQNATPTNVNAR